MKTVFASLALLVGCSNDPMEPGAGNDPGRGTNTLLVDGNVHAEPREGVSNALRATDFETDFSVRVQLNGADVTTGTVTIASKLINVPLTYGGNQRWEGRAPGYDELYRLDIIAGLDKLEGVIVDGPDFHTFVLPLSGATLDSTVPNDIKWTRDDVADNASLRVEDFRVESIPDNKLYTLPPNSLRAEHLNTVENQIRLTRMNHIAPTGGVGGSDFSVSVTNQLDVIAAALP